MFQHMSADNEVWIDLWIRDGDITPSEVSTAIGIDTDWLGGAVDRDHGRDPLRTPIAHRVVVADLERGHEENGTATLDAAVSKLEASRTGLEIVRAKALSMSLMCYLETMGVWESYVAVAPQLLRRIADLGLTLEIHPSCLEREPRAIPH
jgi:hypothetical protein